MLQLVHQFWLLSKVFQLAMVLTESLELIVYNIQVIQESFKEPLMRQLVLQFLLSTNYHFVMVQTAY